MVVVVWTVVRLVSWQWTELVQVGSLYVRCAAGLVGARHGPSWNLC